jgi:hypothetical protein
MRCCQRPRHAISDGIVSGSLLIGGALETGALSYFVKSRIGRMEWRAWFIWSMPLTRPFIWLSWC